MGVPPNFEPLLYRGLACRALRKVMRARAEFLRTEEKFRGNTARNRSNRNKRSDQRFGCYREDGYLLGMDNLISIFEEISIELEEQPTTKPTTTPSNTTDANATVSWALSSQSSGESFEQYPLDSPSLTVSDSSYDYTATPQKPQLKRQVATSEPKENAITNGELNRGDDGLKSVNVTDSPDTNSPETS